MLEWFAGQVAEAVGRAHGLIAKRTVERRKEIQERAAQLLTAKRGSGAHGKKARRIPRTRLLTGEDGDGRRAKLLVKQPERACGAAEFAARASARG